VLLAEEAVDGLAGEFPGGVPHCDLDAADRAHQDRSPAPEGRVEDRPNEPCGVEDTPIDDVRLADPVEDGSDRARLPLERRVSDPDDALVGGEGDDQPVGDSAADEERFDLSDLPSVRRIHDQPFAGNCMVANGKTATDGASYRAARSATTSSHVRASCV